MCGIAGIYNLDGRSLERGKLEAFTDSFTERGPDGSGYDYFDNNRLGLGHRRLSILDLSEGGHQPMYYLGNRYAITYNGEIYNFEEIKQELISLGFYFRTTTDTEVILAAYSKWGADCLYKFNGMWAFAIWDNEDKSLFLARDRFGVKPFYYAFERNKYFVFSSETRAFKFLEDYHREFDYEMIGLQTSGIRIHGSGHTIFKGIKQILPGHYAFFKSDYKEVKQKRWWNISDFIRRDIPETLNEQAEEFYYLLRDACKLRLISDVSIGTALSGGLDSSSVYSLVNDIIRKGDGHRMPSDNQKAFVATFPGLSNDEREFAEQAVAFTKGPVEYLVQEYNDLPARVARDTELFDALDTAPITAVSGIYAGMKKAGITVSLDGHGVDEMMYGYRDMLYNLYSHFCRKCDADYSKILSEIIIPTYDLSEQPRIIKNLENISRESNSIIFRLKEIVKDFLNLSKYDRSKYLTSGNLANIGEFYKFKDLDYADRIVFQETFIDTLPTIFRDFDKAGMMNSVEIRMPFMDWRLVSYIFSLPLESKIGNGFNKLILREAMKGKMSETIRTRKLKIGIGSPVEQWFKNELKTWVLDMFNSTDVRNGLITEDKKFVDNLNKAYKNNVFTRDLIIRAWQELNLHLVK